MPSGVRKALIIGTAVLLPGAATVAGVVGASPAEAAAASFPAQYSAPYLQIAGSDTGDMAADMSASGDKFYTLAFLTPSSGCTPEWEDGSDALGAFTSQVSAFQSAGGNVIISFGGAAGGELAQTCTSVSSLATARTRSTTPNRRRRRRPANSRASSAPPRPRPGTCSGSRRSPARTTTTRSSPSPTPPPWRASPPPTACRSCRSGRWTATWQFKNQNSGLCLDQAGAVTTQGVQFDQWTCKSGTGDNQDFATR
jgi:hypothetical protein